MSKLTPTSAEKSQAYDDFAPIFRGLLREMRELSKKKPDATLSKAKVGIINRALQSIEPIFQDSTQAYFLDKLDDEELPQNSDAVLVMVQYESALNEFRSRHYGYIPRLSEHAWLLD